MTGSEIAAAAAVGKAAAAASKKALDEDPSEKAMLREIGRETPAAKRAAEAHMERVAIRQELRLKLWTPLVKILGIRSDYFTDQFPQEISDRVEHIPDEALVSPRPSLVLPAMQGLAYSLDEPELKEMYLNLLATASDGRRQDDAHPSFAEIIKQLSPAEASLLAIVLAWPQLPIIAVRRAFSDPEGYETMQSHVLDWTDRATGAPKEEPLAAMYVDNWIRLGLIRASYSQFLTNDAHYAWVESRPEVLRAKAEIESDPRPGITLDTAKGMVTRTSFGERFGAAALPTSGDRPNLGLAEDE
ncbi:DUF4393 domain-containing protein [Cellulomonas sp. JH27-2]|uniref:DUF4393 domain-containing protein n=1 Tax=Cellulomonas sp. JH27-2 TaxID=2774139 RepID=UPI00177FE3BB|nr:DUF4393 domain-containing protein [Cellulomonas sp. JH27-2]MBD8057850.1 DUF4393 domain-containing protein [Cellulomonas sp. JH27-2]